MESMGQYFLSVSAAALLVALLQRISPGKGAAATIMKMLCGVFLLFSIINPISDISFSRWEDWSGEFRVEAEYAVSEGQKQAQTELRGIISQRVSAYILDKAEDYNATLTVTVILSEDEIPVPIQVHIRGNISPYGKTQLQSMIANDLGIAKENQIWT